MSFDSVVAKNPNVILGMPANQARKLVDKVYSKPCPSRLDSLSTMQLVKRLPLWTFESGFCPLKRTKYAKWKFESQKKYFDFLFLKRREIKQQLKVAVQATENEQRIRDKTLNEFRLFPRWLQQELTSNIKKAVKTKDFQAKVAKTKAEITNGLHQNPYGFGNQNAPVGYHKPTKIWNNKFQRNKNNCQ